MRRVRFHVAGRPRTMQFNCGAMDAKSKNSPSGPETSVIWTRSIEDEEGIAFRVGRSGDDLVADWPGLARLTCGPDGSTPRLRPCPGASPMALRKMRGAVKALLCDLRGGLGIHASAVAIKSHAILLLGDAGAGKSTTAAQLCLHHGGLLLADDAAVLEERNDVAEVQPSDKEHYLTAASRLALGINLGAAETRGKAPLRPRATARRGFPLSLVAVLRFDDARQSPHSRRLGGSAAIQELLGALLRFDTEDRAARTRELDLILRICSQAPILEVSRPRATPAVDLLLWEALFARGS